MEDPVVGLQEAPELVSPSQTNGRLQKHCGGKGAAAALAPGRSAPALARCFGYCLG